MSVGFFVDRKEAGKSLGALLASYRGEDCVVYALPRGGVPVAWEIAKRLQAPLDLLFAHKISSVENPEYALAAVSEGGCLVEGRWGRISPLWLEQQKDQEIQEMRKKRLRYLKNRLPVSCAGKIAILVDDGVATGLTLEAGVRELRQRRPKKVVVAVPVSPLEVKERLASLVDAFVAVLLPEEGEFLGAVGAYYQKFHQVEDAEVLACLENEGKKA